MGKRTNKLEGMANEELWRLFPIIIREHSGQYSDWYQQEVENLNRIIGADSILRINHIGSTAVKGLMAKPTVDILLELSGETEIGNLKSALKQELKKKFEFNRDAYTEAKTAFVTEYTKRAREEFQGKYSI